MQSTFQPFTTTLRLLIVAMAMMLSSTTTCSAFRPTAIITIRSLTSTTTSTTSLAAESSKMPYDDNEMPFYAMGVNLALQVGGGEKLLDGDSEMDVMLAGFADTLRGKSSQENTRTILSTYGPALNQLLQERSTKLIDTVKKEGASYTKNFLDDNDSAKQTDSGLVYLETKAGTGISPTIESTVEVHYHGTLTDGTVFDSSKDRGETISFPLANVIKGWQEGLQLMKEGGKATLVCPSDIAYGDQGSGGVIPPGATLQFDVELIKASEPAPPPPSQQAEGDEPETVRINIDDILAAKQKQEESEK